MRRNVTEKIRVETQYFESLRSRPAIANPVWMVDQRGEELMRLTARGVELVERHLDYAADATNGLRLRLNSLSPLGTLQRGYSIVEKIEDGVSSVVTATDQVSPNTQLSIRVTDGRIEATVE